MTVEADLPPVLAQGLFARSGEHKVNRPQHAEHRGDDQTGFPEVLMTLGCWPA